MEFDFDLVSLIFYKESIISGEVSEVAAVKAVEGDLGLGLAPTAARVSALRASVTIRTMVGVRNRVSKMQKFHRVKAHTQDPYPHLKTLLCLPTQLGDVGSGENMLFPAASH